MPNDEVQYIKLPNGEYGKFRADASDDVIRTQIMKDFPDAFNAGAPKKSLMEQGREAYAAEKTHGMPGSFEGHPENVGEYIPATAGNVASGTKDITQGNVARGTHKIISGVGNAFLPMTPFVAAASPLAFARIAGLGAAGSYAGSKGAEALGATPEQADVAGDFGGLAGGIYGPRALTATKGAIGDLMRTPYGPTTGASALKPGVKAVASIGKYFGGPELADWMVPERSVGPTGPYSKLPSRLPPALRGDPFSPTLPEATPELGTPENPGWFSKIPNKMPKAAPLSPDWQTPSHETLELGSPEYPGPFSKVPNRLPTVVRGDPFAPASQAATETPRIVPPSVGEPRFTGSEGRAATWKNEDVMRLAAQGNREAIQQAIRRGMQLPPGARYVMGDPDFSRTIYNPRESTTFTPEGTPIRNLQNPGTSAKQRIVLTDPYSPDVPQGNPSPFAPTIERIEPTGPRFNASGEAGGGGLEEAARLSSEKSQGVQYFRENPGGNRVPLTGMGRQDLRASPGQRIVRVDANGLETVLDEQPIRPGKVPRERRGPQ